MKSSISIIVPVFNGAPFIKKAYQGILNQNLEDFELIFVDNNSTDQSSSIISEIEKNDPRVMCAFEIKQGAAAARNKGAAMATKQYLYFFDVDDTLFENALLSLKKVLDTHSKVASVFGKMIRVMPKDDAIESNPRLDIRLSPHFGLYWFNNIANLQGTPSFLHRKSVFKKLDGFPEQLQVGEDAAFHIKLGLTNTVGYIDVPIFKYNRHDASSTSKANAQQAKVFQYWQRIVKVHIPYFLQHKTPKEFTAILYREVFLSIGKMMIVTNKISARKKMRNQALQEIKQLESPFFLKFATYILAITGSSFIYKLYAHYWVKPSVKKYDDAHD